MPRRVLTDEECQRVNAYEEALEAALCEVNRSDYDARSRVSQAVEQAYPLSAETREAMALEKTAQFADPLRQVSSTINLSQLKPDAPWGLVVYRTAYGDDAAWKRMLDELQDPVDSLPYEPAPNPELYTRHRFEFMDDQSQFQGATMQTLRDKFSAWVVDGYRANLREEYRASVEEIDVDMASSFAGTRYNFFLVVDDICLESLDQACGPVVKLVQAPGHEGQDYSLSVEEIQEMGPKEEDSEWEGGLTESEYENVGWMYMETSDYAVFQEYLAEPSNWEDEYLRPPKLRSQDGFEDAPGSWRK
ncbi:hypothetical protein ISF_06194 [Cordyceps fumosorosea ARSEF 2679]|uniref:Uncharacterized protein n=1 Tax=Cordyceps fumosorosea (strain ARSEF 2679) TaxID=1081104 RepID=A0A167S528_CORFA|nr:hypothetical protein ISF_06194 [Cordyceps fumosorosea ARSEF 2679]OAA59259.1 hypothetical protein ISF_06194 [Cordyceps fumosorosea ARSEF 2679]